MPISPNEFIHITWAVWLLSWFVAAAWSSPTEARPAMRSRIVYRVVMSIGAYLLFGLSPTRDVELWHVGRDTAWTLAVLTVAGFGITWWARVTLGRLWSSGVTRKTDHSIITTGPYRFVRHPIYSGVIVAVLATAALRGTAGGCLGAGLIVLGLFAKARIEERFLRVELGEEHYDTYARRVPMLVPFPRM